MEMTQEQICKSNHAGFMTLKQLISIVSIFAIVIGWQFTIISRLESKISTNSTASSEIQAQLAQIQTDLQWIKLNISK